MTLIYNDNPVVTSNDNMTLEEFANWKNIPMQGTAIAINDKLIKHDLWKVTPLHDMDRITVITAAFGG